jgi:glycerol kinase
VKLTELKVDGGASRDKFLMQFQADIGNGNIRRPVIRETTALGAACLAGLAVGFWKDLAEVRALWKCGATFSPAMDSLKRETLLAGWYKAVGRSRNWAEP